MKVHLAPTAFCSLAAVPLLAAATLGAAPVSPQIAVRSLETGQVMESAVMDWKEQHGHQWRVRYDHRTERVNLLYGGAAEPAAIPRSTQEADWFDLARGWIRSTYDMHGIRESDLTQPSFKFLPLAQSNTTDKIAVRFHQVVEGVPVDGGSVNALFDVNGRLLAIQSTGAPKVPDRAKAAVIDGGFAKLAAGNRFLAECGTKADRLSARLVHAGVSGSEGHEWHLAWQVDAFCLDDSGQPHGWTYTVDAATAEILKTVSTVHHFDVFGSVSSWATPGTRADTPANPKEVLRLPRATVSSSAGTVETDRFGRFAILGVNTPIDITVTYEGAFTSVRDGDPSTTASETFTVQPNQWQDVVMNASKDDELAALANVQIHINKVRDFIRDTFPEDATADFQAFATANFVAGGCNAFYRGEADGLDFGIGAAPCANAAFSTVVAHEMGHWLNDRYGVLNNGHMAEGNADVFAMYVHDTPFIGQDFQSPGDVYRSGLNTLQYCGDGLPGGCYLPHVGGQVWMGTAWKIRAALKAAHGPAAGSLAANVLFLGWMNTFNQTYVDSIIEHQWLLLDDDDGDLTNGTPNFAAINDAFLVHGFPGVEIPTVLVSDVTALPDSSTSVGASTVLATVESTTANPITSVNLLFVTNAGVVQTVPMSLVAGTSSDYVGMIPPVSAPSFVRYSVVAEDSAGGSAAAPLAGIEPGFTFTVGQDDVIFTSDFENGDDGFTVGGSNPTGKWVRSAPLPANYEPSVDQTVDGVNCWQTGLSAAPDFPLGLSTGTSELISPSLDTSGAGTYILSYSRWFSNISFGQKDDDFLVEAKLDNGTWQPLETIDRLDPQASGGWYKSRIDITAVAAMTDTLSVRFVAADLGAFSVIEAAIDEFDLVRYHTTPLPAPFCTSNPNSSSDPALIEWKGSQRISLNNSTLSAAQVPSSTTGRFLMSQQQATPPTILGSGLMCLAGSVLRFPPVQSSSTGTVTQPLDFTDPSSAASTVLVGSTWNFQYVFFDTPAVALNSSNGIAVQFEY